MDHGNVMKIMKMEDVEYKKLKFCGQSNSHYNQVDLIIDKDNIILNCYTDGYKFGKSYKFGTSSKFPNNIKPTYENIIDYIKKHTWIGKNIEDIIDKETYIEFMKEWYLYDK